VRDHNYITALAVKEVARLEAERKAERDAADAAERAAADEQATTWRNAIAPIAVSCGVRPFCLDAVVEKAHTVFELKDGQVVPKPGVMHPRDPCKDLDPVTFFADLRNGEDGDLLFGK
jgi:hypothetical protein